MKHLRRFKGFQGKLAEFVPSDDDEGWYCSEDFEAQRRCFEAQRRRMEDDAMLAAMKIAEETSKRLLSKMKSETRAQDIEMESEMWAQDIGESQLLARPAVEQVLVAPVVEQVLVAPAPAPGAIQIFVRTLTGKTLTLIVDRDETVPR